MQYFSFPVIPQNELIYRVIICAHVIIYLKVIYNVLGTNDRVFVPRTLYITFLYIMTWAQMVTLYQHMSSFRGITRKETSKFGVPRSSKHLVLEPARKNLVFEVFSLRFRPQPAPRPPEAFSGHQKTSFWSQPAETVLLKLFSLRLWPQWAPGPPEAFSNLLCNMLLSVLCQVMPVNELIY